MSAAGIISRVRDTGGNIVLDQDQIRLQVPASVRDAIVAEITANKTAVKHALRQEQGGRWDADDYRALYHERAGVAEYDNHQPRNVAERLAFDCAVVEWLKRHPVTSPAYRCGHCGKIAGDADALLPYGTEGAGHVWLHARCWSTWYEGRLKLATSALAAMGIVRI